MQHSERSQRHYLPSPRHDPRWHQLSTRRDKKAIVEGHWPHMPDVPSYSQSRRPLIHPCCRCEHQSLLLLDETLCFPRVDGLLLLDGALRFLRVDYYVSTGSCFSAAFYFSAAFFFSAAFSFSAGFCFCTGARLALFLRRSKILEGFCGFRTGRLLIRYLSLLSIWSVSFWFLPVAPGCHTRQWCPNPYCLYGKLALR